MPRYARGSGLANGEDVVDVYGVVGPDGSFRRFVASDDLSTPVSSSGAASVGTTVDASYFGVYAGTSDMTTQLENALNAAFYEGLEILLPPGDINISGQILVTAPYGAQYYPTFGGQVNWNKPVGIRGYGPLKSRIVQNTPGVGIARYFPQSQGWAHGKFSDFSLVNTNRDYTNIYQFGIQLGGGPGDCVSENHIFRNVSGIGLYAVVRLDDTTGVLFTGSAQNQNFKYYCEGAANSDQFTFRDFYMSHDHPNGVACSSSTGTTISGISTEVMPYLFVGGSVVGAGIPADTIIVSKGTTSIVVSNAVTAVTSFDFKLGTLLSLLGGSGTQCLGSGFAQVINENNWFAKTKTWNPKLITFDSVLWNRGEGLVEDYGSSYGMDIRGIYMESAKRIAKFAGAGPKGLSINGIFLSQPQSLRQPLIEISSNAPQGYIRNITTDGTLGTTVAVSAPNVNTSSLSGTFEVSDVPGNVVTGGGPALSATVRKVSIGTAANGSAVMSYSTADGDANFDGLGVDQVRVTLTQSGRSINGPNSIHAPEGRKLNFLFVQNTTGGWTITLNSKYKKPDGTAWGLLPAGTANQRAVLSFMSLGNGNYVSQQSTLGWA